MKSLRKSTIFVLATLAVMPLALLSGQEPKPDTPAPVSGAQPQAQPPQDTPATPASGQNNGQGRIVFSVNQVIVPVTVKDSEGRLVPDLRKDEFRIFEDNVEQRIGYFSNEAFPLSMVVLIDNDLKRKDAEEVAASLRSILSGMSTADEADICRFDQFFHPGKGFDANQDQLLTQLRRTELDTEPAVAPPSPSMTNGPTINGHAANSDAPNIQSGVQLIKGQSTKTLDDALYSAAQLLNDRGRER